MSYSQNLTTVTGKAVFKRVIYRRIATLKTNLKVWYLGSERGRDRGSQRSVMEGKGMQLKR